jgi:hypothetical protein
MSSNKDLINFDLQNTFKFFTFKKRDETRLDFNYKLRDEMGFNFVNFLGPTLN